MFTAQEMERYSRHIMLKEIGGIKQATLKEKTVFLFGEHEAIASAAFYLVASGVGKLLILKEPRHEPASGCHDQMLFDHLEQLNTDVKIQCLTDLPSLDGLDMTISCFFSTWLQPTRSHPWLQAYEGTLLFSFWDGFGGASIYSTQGDQGCYLCASSGDFIDSAFVDEEQAIIASRLGCLMASEAIRLLLGLISIDAQSCLRYDPNSETFRRVSIERDPHCTRCGSGPS
ncbi:HesA/MoeB/ThiF family protein [Magnetococcales bacterium HHB-1]